jgi:DNA-binding HxlR family transcriptional regulator
VGVCSAKPLFRVRQEALIPTVPPPKRHPYDQWSPDARALDLVGDKWTLLIIRDLAGGPRRFVELQRVLPGISTEQLRSRLNRMVAYELTERSRELMPVIGALARWGYDWTWSAPRPGEDVNVGAVFRLAPGLIEPPAGMEGSIDLVVEGAGETPERRYRLSASRGRLEISENAPDDGASATVTGSQDAWVRALGPDGSSEALDFTGNRGLADALLGAFTSAAAARRAA